jgi:hypothetical protein
VDGMTEAEKLAIRNGRAGDKSDDKAWKSAKKKLDKNDNDSASASTTAPHSLRLLPQKAEVIRWLVFVRLVRR